MKKTLFCTLAIIGLFSCSGDLPTEEISNANESGSSQEENAVELNDSITYSVSELKELYAVGWKGEEKGNASLDGKQATLEGTVFSIGKKSKSVDGAYTVYGAKIEFRVSKFADPDFGHDLECHFSAEFVDQISALKKGSSVKIKGTLDKQEVYIEPNLKYSVLSLKDCELL